jgi:hypothetical protein
VRRSTKANQVRLPDDADKVIARIHDWQAADAESGQESDNSGQLLVFPTTTGLPVIRRSTVNRLDRPGVIFVLLETRICPASAARGRADVAIEACSFEHRRSSAIGP